MWGLPRARVPRPTRAECEDLRGDGGGDAGFALRDRGSTSPG